MFGDDLKLEASLWSFSHVGFVSEKNDTRNSEKESQMKAKLKILAKPSNLSQVFRKHLTDYSTRSLNVFETYFDITG